MRCCLLALILLVPLMTSAAAPRDAFLEQYATTRRFLNGRPTGFRFTGDGKALLFLRSGPTSSVQSLFSMDLSTGAVQELLTAEALLQGAAQSLSVEEKARLERLRTSARGIIGYTLSDDGRLIATSISGRLYLFDRETGKVKALKTGEGAPIDPKFSPDGKHIAYVRGSNLYVLELSTQRERQLTRGAVANITNGLAEFVAQEEMRRYSGFWWSPDSKAIAYQRTDTSHVEPFAIVDPTHPEKGATVFPYPRPGKNNADVLLGVVSIDGGRTTWVKWDARTYPYLARVAWPKGGLHVLVQNRLQTEEKLLRADPKNGRTKEILTETDEAWLNLDRQLPVWLGDGSGFLWFTERNGGPEIELRDPDGAFQRTLVPKELGYDELVGWNDDTRTLYFLGSPNPTESVLYRVRDGGVPERVTTDEPGPAMQAAIVSKDGQHLVVITTTLKYMPKAAVWRADGTRLAEVPSVAIEPTLQPTTEILKVGPGEGFYSAVIRPRDFKQGRKYPVVVQVYGGPHHTEVRNSVREELLLQWLADQGFIVVKSDNRGTTHRRGRAWERAIKNDLAGVPMDDQVAALRALAAELPELDLTRVGITGWSYGGYMAALGVLRYPDVFRVAVAGAPVVDWRDYDTHYTERYLGLPQENAAAYDKASLLTWADRLEGSLLLIHGTADDNVYFFHTLKLSDALFRSGKLHDVLPLSDFTHMVADPNVTIRLQQRMLKQLADVLKPER